VTSEQNGVGAITQCSTGAIPCICIVIVSFDSRQNQTVKRFDSDPFIADKVDTRHLPLCSTADAIKNVAAIEQVRYLTLQAKDSTLAGGENQASSFVFIGPLRWALQTTISYFNCKLPYDATRRLPTLTHMSLTRSGLSFLHALAGSSTPRVQLHLLLRTARHRSDRTIHSTTLPTPPPLSTLETSKDAAAARDWLMRFRACSIPRAAVDLTFSRSSGPGGQVCASNRGLHSHRTGD
jgi:hypothetical protein